MTSPEYENHPGHILLVDALRAKEETLRQVLSIDETIQREYNGADFLFQGAWRSPGDLVLSAGLVLVKSVDVTEIGETTATDLFCALASDLYHKHQNGLTTVGHIMVNVVDKKLTAAHPRWTAENDYKLRSQHQVGQQLIETMRHYVRTIPERTNSSKRNSRVTCLANWESVGSRAIESMGPEL